MELEILQLEFNFGYDWHELPYYVFICHLFSATSWSNTKIKASNPALIRGFT